MLQTIRERTQGWIAGTIISIIILTFALWGIHSYFVGGGNTNVIAEVNGTEVTKEQLAVAYGRLRHQVQSQYGASALLKDESLLKAQALQTLIENEALKQASFNEGFRIYNSQVDSYLEGIPAFQVDGQFSIERFQEVLSSTMLSTGEFLELIKSSLLIDQPKLGVVFSAFALPEETDEVIALVNQERDIEYLSISTQQFLTQPIKIAPERIEAYYNEHKKDFMTAEQVNVEYVELSIANLMAGIEASDDALKSFYNENVNSYTRPMEWKLIGVQVPVAANAKADDVKQASAKAESIVQALEKGEDVHKVARENASTAITYDWVTLSRSPAELQKAIAQLNKVGQVAAPIKTPQGWVIVKVTDIKEPKIQSFEEARAKVKEVYVRQHAEEKFAEQRDRLADTAYEKPDSLQPAAKALNLPVKTSELFSKDATGKDIAQYKKVRDAAFSNDVLNLQNNSDVIQLTPDTVAVVRVKSHVPSSLLPLQNVALQIENKLKLQEAELRTETFAKDLLAKLQSGENSQQVTSAAHLSWHRTGFTGRYAKQVDSAILELAFRIPYKAESTKPAYQVTRLPTGYAIVAVKGVKNGSLTDKKQYNVFAEQVQNSTGFLEYELYKQSQLNAAKIEVKQNN